MATAGAVLARIDEALEHAYASGRVEGDDGESFPVHPTGTDSGQGRGLRELVVAEKAARTFEVGFALGLSSLHIAAGLVEAGQPAPRHLAIDPTEASVWHNAGRRLVERAGADAVVAIVEESSHVVLPRWLDDGEVEFDVAFIDGDHRFDPAFLDIYYALRLVKPAGLIVVDDMWMPSVRMAVAFFESNLDLELIPDAIPDAFRWNRRVPWRKVRSGTGNTAVLRKPAVYVDRPGDHFIPFW